MQISNCQLTLSFVLASLSQKLNFPSEPTVASVPCVGWKAMSFTYRSIVHHWIIILSYIVAPFPLQVLNFILDCSIADPPQNKQTFYTETVKLAWGLSIIAEFVLYYNIQFQKLTGYISWVCPGPLTTERWHLNVKLSFCLQCETVTIKIKRSIIIIIKIYDN